MFRLEAIFEPTPTYPSCHAATLVELPNRHLLAAWFAGTHEGHPDIAVWLARSEGHAWNEPTRLIDVPDVPLWNPVLFRDATDTVWLFYKIGPTIPAWTGMYVKFSDGKLHLVYTYQRRHIQHVALDPDDLVSDSTKHFGDSPQLRTEAPIR